VFFFVINKQVDLLKLPSVKKYDEELFTSLFDLTNKFEIRKICIRFDYRSLSNKDVKNICAKIYKKIRSLETQNIISNEVVINVQGKIQRYWKLTLEAKLVKGQPPIFTNWLEVDAYYYDLSSNDFQRITEFLTNSNIEVELLRTNSLRKYNEELFTILFDLTNKFVIRKVCIEF